MKALSVRQPWAWLIVAGYKGIENRTWETRHRGPLLIHAGKTFDWPGYFRLAGLVGMRGRLSPGDLPQAQEKPELRFDERYKLGGIIGRVELADIRADMDRFCVSDLADWAEIGMRHWVMERPVELEFVACPGKQGIFEVAL